MAKRRGSIPRRRGLSPEKRRQRREERQAERAAEIARQRVALEESKLEMVQELDPVEVLETDGNPTDIR